MIIKTVRELKNMLNSITDEKVLNKEIKYCCEDNGFGTIAEGAWFDIQSFGYGDVETCCFPTITLCINEEDLKYHEGRSSWLELSKWMR